MLSLLAGTFRIAARTDAATARETPSRDWPFASWAGAPRPEWPAPLHWYQRGDDAERLRD